MFVLKSFSFPPQMIYQSAKRSLIEGIGFEKPIDRAADEFVEGGIKVILGHWLPSYHRRRIVIDPMCPVE